MSKIFHILYIDKNPSVRSLLVNHFAQEGKSASFPEQYRVKVTTFSDMRSAMRALLLSNIEALSEDYLQKFNLKLLPFDTLIFPLEQQKNAKEYGWDRFLKYLERITLRRLNLTAGLIATGSPTAFTADLLEVLMAYGVRKKILYPFTFEQFEEAIADLIQRHLGSGSFFHYIQPEPMADGRTRQRRTVRFNDSEESPITIGLDCFVFDEETLITKLIETPFDIPSDGSSTNEESLHL
jgi:hypothetical protein